MKMSERFKSACLARWTEDVDQVELLRQKYTVAEACRVVGVPISSYYSHCKRLGLSKKKEVPELKPGEVFVQINEKPRTRVKKQRGGKLRIDLIGPKECSEVPVNHFTEATEKSKEMTLEEKIAQVRLEVEQEDRQSALVKKLFALAK